MARERVISRVVITKTSAKKMTMDVIGEPHDLAEMLISALASVLSDARVEGVSNEQIGEVVKSSVVALMSPES